MLQFELEVCPQSGTRAEQYYTIIIMAWFSTGGSSRWIALLSIAHHLYLVFKRGPGRTPLSNIKYLVTSTSQSKPKDTRKLYEQVLKTPEAYPSTPLFLHNPSALASHQWRKRNLSLVYPWLSLKASNTPK